MGEGDNCTICLDKVCANDNVVTTLPCEHFFHKDCINPWRESGNTTCPVCRRPMDPEEVDNAYNGDDEEEKEEEPSIPNRGAVPAEPSLPSSPQQGYASTYPPYLSPQWGNVGMSYLPFTQPQGESAGYMNHSQMSSLPWPVISEPPRRLSPNNWGCIVENHQQTSSQQLPVPDGWNVGQNMIMLAVFLLFIVNWCFPFGGVNNFVSWCFLGGGGYSFKVVFVVSAIIWVIMQWGFLVIIAIG